MFLHVMNYIYIKLKCLKTFPDLTVASLSG